MFSHNYWIFSILCPGMLTHRLVALFDIVDLAIICLPYGPGHVKINAPESNTETLVCLDNCDILN